MGENIHANRNQKKAGVARRISDKIDLKMKKVVREKEGHYIMIKGSIQEENITILDIYTPNMGSPQYIRQPLTTLKGEIDNKTIIYIYRLLYQNVMVTTNQKSTIDAIQTQH